MASTTKEILFPLLHKRLQLMSVNDTTEQDIEAHERFKMTAPVLAGQSITLTLTNAIKADRHVFVETENLLLKAVEDVEIEYTAGGNTVVVTPQKFNIAAGEEITVYDTYGKAFVSAQNVVLGSGGITASVQPNGDVQITYNVQNNAATSQPVNLSMQMTDGGSNIQNKTASYTAPAGASTAVYTFTGLSAATYTFNSLADLAGSVTPIVVPSLAPNFVYGTPVITPNGTDYKITVPVSNTGSADGATSVYMQLDSGSKVRIGDTLVPKGQTINFVYTYLANSVGAHTLKAFQSDTTTQTGSTVNFTIAGNQPAGVAGKANWFMQAFNGFPSYFSYPDSPYADSGIGNFGGGTISRALAIFDTTGITTLTAAKLVFRYPNSSYKANNLNAFISSAVDPLVFSQAFNNYDSGNQLIASRYDNTAAGQVEFTLSAYAIAYINSHSELRLLLKTSNEGTLYSFGTGVNLIGLVLAY